MRMAEGLTGNMLIAQSGGPTMVINQTLVGAILEAKKHGMIRNIYGSMHGIKGVMEENMIDLGRESRSGLDLVVRGRARGVAADAHGGGRAPCRGDASAGNGGA